MFSFAVAYFHFYSRVYHIAHSQPKAASLIQPWTVDTNGPHPIALLDRPGSFYALDVAYFISIILRV